MREFNKIFGIGLSRTGTHSLAAALDFLGIPTVHWPLDFKEICASRGAVDITVSCRFRELDQMFPGSLFVYTERDEAGWLASVTTHYRRLGNGPRLPDGEKQFAQEADARIYGSIRPLQCDFSLAYRRHHEIVEDYFRGSEDRLLRLNIVRDSAWAALCEFLDLPTLSIPFPHAGGRM